MIGNMVSTNATKLKEKKNKKKSRSQYKRTPWKNSADGIAWYKNHNVVISPSAKSVYVPQ